MSVDRRENKSSQSSDRRKDLGFAVKDLRVSAGRPREDRVSCKYAAVLLHPDKTVLSRLAESKIESLHFNARHFSRNHLVLPNEINPVIGQLQVVLVECPVSG